MSLSTEGEQHLIEMVAEEVTHRAGLPLVAGGDAVEQPDHLSINSNGVWELDFKFGGMSEQPPDPHMKTSPARGGDVYVQLISWRGIA